MLLAENSSTIRQTWASDIVTILSIAMSTCGLAIALATLVFTGPSADGLPRGISSFIVGGAVVGLVLGLKSRLNPLIAGTQDAATVVLIAVIASVLAGNTQEPAMATIVLMGFSCAITGIAMWLVGQLGLGGVIRSLPTTVVTGFVAGTGWLLLVGGLSVMVNQRIGLATLPLLMQDGNWVYWLPGMSLAVMILLLSSSSRLPPIATSVLIFAAIAVFFSVALSQSSISQLERQHWLIGPFPESSGIQFISLTEILQFPWGKLLADAQVMLPVILVSCIGVLLNISGLEFIFKQRVNLNAELKATGLVNLVIAPLGGVVGYHLLGASNLARQLGAHTKLVPVGVAVLSIFLAVFGSEMIGYLPRFVAGGVLAASGLGLLVSWLYVQLPALFRLDRLLSIIIVAVIALMGVLEGIAVGIVIACVIFIVQYSRINPVRFMSTGVSMRSRVDRPTHVFETLTKLGHKTAVFELQGYLFFGTTTHIAGQIEERANAQERPDTIIVDGSLVTGIDVSGFAVLKQVLDDLAHRNITVLISGLSPALAQALQKAQPSLQANDLVIDTLDHALERAENLLLADLLRSGDTAETVMPSAPQLPLSQPLLDQFDVIEIEAGSTLIEQNQPVDSFYIVKGGIGNVYHVKGTGAQERIRRFEPGTLLGEIGFLLKRNSTAKVVAETPMTLYRMTREQFQRLGQNNAALMLELQDFLLKSSVIRVASINQIFTSTLR